MVEQEKIANPASTPRQFQFSLRYLFVGITIACLVFALFAWLGGLATVPVIVVGCLFGLFEGIRRRNDWLMCASVGLPIVLCVLLPTTSVPHPVSKRSACVFNLKQIGMALHDYHDVHGSLPPAFVCDESGQPAHSWRVLILPYVEQEPLFKKYDFTEPWDGPNNSALASTMPRLFRCPSDKTASKSFTTNYVAVVGPGTPWPGAKSAKFDDLQGGMANTILVVEVVGANISWMEPRDLDVGTLNPVVNSKSTTGISSRHPGGANVLFADGHIEFLPADKLPTEIQALLTPPKK